MTKKAQRIEPGRFYGKLTPDGPLVPTPDEGLTPDLWICRRVADFPNARVPTGGRLANCTRCFAPIVFNPARTVSAPKVCMQCASIQPLPIEDPS